MGEQHPERITEWLDIDLGRLSGEERKTLIAEIFETLNSGELRELRDIASPFRPRLAMPVSGLYVRRALTTFSPGGSLRPAIVETLRLDVDGWYPQMAASGTYARTLFSIQGPIDWVAYPLVEVQPGVWEGNIVWTWSQWSGPMPFFYPRVRINAPHRGYAVVAPNVTLTFSGEAASVTHVLQFESPYFRTAEMEIDTVQDSARVTSINTCAHANHPPSLPCQQLSMTEVYSRAGVELRQSPNPSVVPLAGAGADNHWSDHELNDAMYTYWSRYKSRAQWALWLLFAGRYFDTERGVNNGVRGVMFDYSGTFQRQGAAVFSDVFADTDVVPANYPQRDAHIRRMRFFAAIHESGHCFNLAHSWRKTIDPWWPVSNEPDAVSFMNYPERLIVENFFRDFEYRFSDRELRFLRHAPESFVEMADAPFEMNHGYDPDLVETSGGWDLAVSVGCPRSLFEFLEPVTIGIRLTNAGNRPQVLDMSIIRDARSFTVTVTGQGGRVRAWRPYAHHCWGPSFQVLQPGESVESAFFVGAGVNGWDLAEPGRYTIGVSLRTEEIDVTAPPFALRIASPRSWDEEWIAQELFTDEVGRALAFGGTTAMVRALDALRNVTDRLPDRAVARHARLALALPGLRDQKTLRLPEGEAPMASVAADNGQLVVTRARPDESRRLLDAALLEDRDAAQATFGEWTFRRHLERYARWLAASGDAPAAERVRGQRPSEGQGQPDHQAERRSRRPRRG